MSDDVRLSKLMAEKGLCSRREADEFIARGWVRVDGKIISQLGTKVSKDARIELSDKAQLTVARKVTILLNKPVGFVSMLPEKGYRPAIQLITKSNQIAIDLKQFTSSHLRGLAVAGRLDIDSKGLLVFTQDGRVAKALIGASSEIEKEYVVKVTGLVTADKIKTLCYGLSLDGKKLKKAKVELVDSGRGALEGKASTLKFILMEGRKRQIRRMCECVGLKVTSLVRVRIGRVELKGLPVGRWRYLREDEEF